MISWLEEEEEDGCLRSCFLLFVFLRRLTRSLIRDSVDVRDESGLAWSFGSLMLFCLGSRSYYFFVWFLD